MIIGLILKKQEDRRTADRELLYSTSLATAALESTHDGILIVDLEGKIARWNNIFVELWHVPQHLLDMTVKDPVLSYVCSQMENPDEFLAKVLELYNCPDKTSTDLLHLADGRIFERYSQPQRVGNEIVGRFWSFHDITERRISEQKLLDEREFSNVALNSLPGVFYIIGPDNRFLRWNDNFENVCEYSSEEFSQISPLDLFEGNDKNLIRARIEEVFVKGVSDAEAEIVTRSGKHIPYYFTGRTIKVDGVACLIGMGIDITERKKKDEALAESEESYRNLFNLATDGIFILDSEGNFIDANKTAYERLGYTRDELLSLHISELDHPDFAINAPRRLQQVVDQYSAIFESGHMRKDGSMMPVEVNSRQVQSKPTTELLGHEKTSYSRKSQRTV